MTTERFAYSPTALRTAYNWILVGGPILVFVAISVVLATSAASNDAALLDALLYTEDGGIDWEFAALITLLPVVFAVLLLIKQGRVSLDDHGLQLYMPRASGAGLVGLTTGSHSLSWEQVRSFRTECPARAQNLANGLAGARLVIKTDGGEYRLQPYHYVALEGPDHRMGFREMLRKPALHLETLVNNAPLVQAVRERAGEQLEVAADAEDPQSVELPAGANYNLLHHGGMVTQLVLLGLLGGYALVDFLLLTQYWMVGAVPVLPFVASGVAAAALAMALGRGAPVAERVGVAVMVVAAALAATYPGLMRHALVSAPQPEELSYRAVETAVFEHPRAPTLDFRGRNLDAFWEQAAPPGTRYPFRVHSAKTGVQVLDLHPVHAQTRDFYETRNDG